MSALGRARRAVVAAAIGLLGFWLVASAPAYAESCADTVVDGAHVVTPDLSGVLAAATSLTAATGAEVRVLTVPNLAGQATLDAFVKHWVQQCPSLLAPDGAIKTNLIVFAMSMEGHDVGIFYGDTWKPAFTGANTETRIWQDFMVPRFQSGQFGQGFIEAMKETQRVLSAYLHPGQPAESTGNGRTAAWVGGAGAAALLLGIGGPVWVSAARNKRAAAKHAEEERQAARAKLVAARDAVMNGLLELDGHKADVDVAAVYEPVAPDMATARADYTTAMDAANQAILTDTTQDRDDLTRRDYEKALESYDAAGPEVEKARQAVAAIGAIESDVKAAMEKLPETYTAEAAKNSEAHALLATMAAGGLRLPVDVETAVASLDEDLGGIRSGPQEMAVVLPGLAALRKKRDDAVAGATAVKGQADDFTGQLKALTGAVGGLDVDACEAQLAHIRQDYAEGCWQDAVAQCAAARQARTQAEASRAAAEAAGRDQQWETAAEAAKEGFAAVDAFTTHAAALAGVLASLQEAPGQLKAVQASAQNAIDVAWEYARSHTEDDPAHEAGLTKATKTLAASDARGSKPDWVAAIALAEAAETIADDVLTMCANEVAQAERNRIAERRLNQEKKLHERQEAELARLRAELDRYAGRFVPVGQADWVASSGSLSSSSSSVASSASLSLSGGSGGAGFSGSSGSFGGGGGLSGSSGTW